MEKKARVKLFFIKANKTFHYDLTGVHTEDASSHLHNVDISLEQATLPGSGEMIVHFYVRDHSTFWKQLHRLSKTMKGERLIMGDSAYYGIASIGNARKLLVSDEVRT
ncbi:MAG: hypothetical protein INR73_19835 [Williamsia sp.]|nr:hypothetical protein [Williamsia sp.]